MDHTLSALQVTSKICKILENMQVILIGSGNVMYFLRANYHYKLIISKDIQNKGCGLVTFDKADMIETTGFKWNLGPNHQFHSLNWEEFESTSNIIEKD
jgi:thiamine pyrophosphokinase